MPAPDPLAPFLEPLERLALPYCITGSDKHLRDIRFILAATPIERAFVESEVARRGLGEQWPRCAA